jgi:SAM-dependent methyltransferase
MFLKYAADRCTRGASGPRRLVSLGAGNCALEIQMAAYLRGIGCHDFVIDCLELNPAMLQRARDGAAQAAVMDHLNLLQFDLNAWTATHEYDVVIANQSLHHVLNLENLFDQIGRSLKPAGALITSDMIGRNGHLRWPEALDIVQEFWRRLPPAYRFNRRFERYEKSFEDWDCSVGNFEGIRAQDILPLLIGHFHFELFVAYANVIDPFVDRTYGANFDPASSWDRDFIDEVHNRDERELASGSIKPTHMLAVLGKDPSVPAVCRESLTPAFCVRDPSRVVVSAAVAPGYDWEARPANRLNECEIALRLEATIARLKEANALVEERTAWALRQDQELEQARRRIIDLQQAQQESTAWALSRDRELDQARATIEQLNVELKERTAWVEKLDREWKARTEWATRLEQELTDQSDRVRQLEREFRERTDWALELRRQLERLAWAQPLDHRFHKILAWLFRPFGR